MFGGNSYVKIVAFIEYPRERTRRHETLGGSPRCGLPDRPGWRSGRQARDRSDRSVRARADAVPPLHAYAVDAAMGDEPRHLRQRAPLPIETAPGLIREVVCPVVVKVPAEEDNRRIGRRHGVRARRPRAEEA